MTKLVSTEMTDKSVIISVQIPCGPLESNPNLTYEFPFSVVNPRVALQIATLLVSDPTIPECDGKEAK